MRRRPVAGGNAGGQRVDAEERDVPQRGDNKRLCHVKGERFGRADFCEHLYGAGDAGGEGQLVSGSDALDEDLSDMAVGDNGIGSADETGADEGIAGMAGELETADAAEERLDGGAGAIPGIPVAGELGIGFVDDVECGAEGGKDEALEVVGVLIGDGFVCEGALEGVGGFGSDGEVRGDGGRRGEFDVGSAGGFGALRACRLASAEDGQRRTELDSRALTGAKSRGLPERGTPRTRSSMGATGNWAVRTSKLSRVRPSRRAISRT